MPKRKLLKNLPLRTQRTQKQKVSLPYEAADKSDTYKELEVKKQNSPLLNFLLRGHPAEFSKLVLILCLTAYPSEQLCL